eukprot:gene333-biopygen308
MHLDARRITADGEDAAIITAEWLHHIVLPAEYTEVRDGCRCLDTGEVGAVGLVPDLHRSCIGGQHEASGACGGAAPLEEVRLDYREAVHVVLNQQRLAQTDIKQQHLAGAGAAGKQHPAVLLCGDVPHLSGAVGHPHLPARDAARLSHASTQPLQQPATMTPLTGPL